MVMKHPKSESWDEMKQDVKKLVAVIGVLALVLNMILFAIGKIDMITFFIIIGGFGLISYVFFRQKKENLD